MFEWFWDGLWAWVIYTVPWWVWAILVLAVAAWVFIMIRLAVGPKTALVIVGSGLAAAAVAILSQRSAKAGYDARGKKEQKNADTTLDRAHDARADAAARDADPGRLRQDDGFKRKS